MWQEITPEFLVIGLGWYAVFLIAITCHEAAHAWAAYRLGDPTAYFAGQVTLNPGPHIEREPIGTILMPILSYWRMGVMLGWASAPYDPYWAAAIPAPRIGDGDGGTGREPDPGLTLGDRIAQATTPDGLATRTR